MDTTTPEEKGIGILKHTPKMQFAMYALAVLYFSLAIYLLVKQIQLHKTTN